MPLPDTMSPLEKSLQDYVAHATRTEPDPAAYSAAHRRIDHRTIRLLHAAMGLCTEAGEFIDQLKKHIFYGKPLDRVNLIEELGDSSWYERVAVDALEVTYMDMLKRNVSKLQARFPEKFTETHAKERDLVKERIILESNTDLRYPVNSFPHNTHSYTRSSSVGSGCAYCGLPAEEHD